MRGARAKELRRLHAEILRPYVINNVHPRLHLTLKRVKRAWCDYRKRFGPDADQRQFYYGMRAYGQMFAAQHKRTWWQVKRDSIREWFQQAWMMVKWGRRIA